MLTMIGARGADRRAGDTGVLRRWLRIRPAVSLNSAGRCRPLAYFGIESSGLSLVVDLLILFVVVLYLSLIYWTYADARRRHRRSMADRLRHRGVAVPVRGHDHLHDPAPARVPRGRARARTGDAGRRGAPAQLDHGAVPALRLSDRARLHPLPELPAQAQGALRQLLAPARPGVDDLPLLRGRRARDVAPRSRRRRGASAEIESDLGEFDAPTATATADSAAAARSRRRRGTASDSRAITRSTFRRPPRRRLSRTLSRQPRPSRRRRDRVAQPVPAGARARAPEPRAPARKRPAKESMDRTLILSSPTPSPGA